MTQHSRLLLRLGDAKAAATAYRALFDKLTRLNGPEDVATLDAMAGLADAVGRSGDNKRAHTLDVQLLDRRQKVLGLEHPATLWAIGDLAWNLEQLGDLSGAAARFSELAEARTATLGPDEPDTVWALQGLVRVLARMEAHDDARRAYARLYETQDRRLGAEAEETIEAMRGLAWEQGKVGELEAARSGWRQLVNVHEQLHGSRDERTLDAMVALAGALDALEQEEQARILSERVAGPLGRLYAGSAEELGPDDPRTLTLGHNLGVTLERLGQCESARATYQRTLEGQVRVQGKRGRAVADLHGHLGNIAVKLGDPAAGHAKYGEALAILRKQPGPEDPDTLEVIGHDADALMAMGKKIAARNRARTVVDGYRRTLGEENPLTRRAQARLDAISPTRRRPAY
jgi:tetratricopeptide (TPR) repeat protein